MIQFQNMMNDLLLNAEVLNPEDLILDYVPINGNLLALPLFGFVISIVFGYTFWRLIKVKIDRWNSSKIGIFPLSNYKTVSSYSGIFLGLTIFFAGSIYAFGFSYESAFFSSFLIALLSAVIIWNQLSSLLNQVEKGKVKEIDMFF